MEKCFDCYHLILQENNQEVEEGCNCVTSEGR